MPCKCGVFLRYAQPGFPDAPDLGGRDVASQERQRPLAGHVERVLEAGMDAAQEST